MKVDFELFSLSIANDYRGYRALDNSSASFNARSLDFNECNWHRVPRWSVIVMSPKVS